jgi:hypothetical protein
MLIYVLILSRMDEDLRYLIKETKTLVEENNKMLHSIQRRAKWGVLWRTFYWIIIIGVGFGAFYYVQPYAEKMFSIYDSLRQVEQKVTDMPSKFNLKNMFQKESATTTP